MIRWREERGREREAAEHENLMIGLRMMIFWTRSIIIVMITTIIIIVPMIVIVWSFDFDRETKSRAEFWTPSFLPFFHGKRGVCGFSKRFIFSGYCKVLFSPSFCHVTGDRQEKTSSVAMKMMRKRVPTLFSMVQDKYISCESVSKWEAQWAKDTDMEFW